MHETESAGSVGFTKLWQMYCMRGMVCQESEDLHRVLIRCAQKPEYSYANLYQLGPQVEAIYAQATAETTSRLCLLHAASMHGQHAVKTCTHTWETLEASSLYEMSHRSSGRKAFCLPSLMSPVA